MKTKLKKIILFMLVIILVMNFCLPVFAEFTAEDEEKLRESLEALGTLTPEEIEDRIQQAKDYENKTAGDILSDTLRRWIRLGCWNILVSNEALNIFDRQCNRVLNKCSNRNRNNNRKYFI